MGHVISPNKRSDPMNGASRSLPGTLDEPPPPYYEDHSRVGQAQQPSTPQTNAARMRKVFVSSRRNGRRPEFAGSKTLKPSTSRKALSGAFGSAIPMISPKLTLDPQHDFAVTQNEGPVTPARDSASAFGQDGGQDGDEKMRRTTMTKCSRDSKQR